MTYDFAVIGAGVFGAWTAWHLRQLGHSVLLADAWGPGHSRSSSGDETRITRLGYGRDAIYTRMAKQSLTQWKALGERTGQQLFLPTGALWIARHSNLYSRRYRRNPSEPKTRPSRSSPWAISSAASRLQSAYRRHLRHLRAGRSGAYGAPRSRWASCR